MTAPPTGPNNMAWLDAGLSALDGVALSAASKFQVVTNVSLFVIGRARFSADLATRSAQSEDDDVAYGA
ncbi:TetR/AcrR family transcriptional regulator C-terminal domain-containing protein, partial [Rhodococcus erythropolis]|nr:TetR/AcrR family transcriptional regulator C-terminal domain-containing protein [Rhodococcus erythropolis]